MKKLYLYISKKFITIFIFTSFAFGFVVLISELFRRLDYYMEGKASLFVIAQYLLSNVPWWTIQVLPVSTLLALLFSLGDFAKKNEITAMKAAGINMWRVITMFLMTGVLIGAMDLAAREFIIPKTAALNEIIKKEKINKEEIKLQTEFTDLIISLPNNVRLTVGHIDAKEKIMQNIIIEKYSEEFYLEDLILAEKGFWKNRTWILKNGVERKFTEELWDEMYFKEYDSQIHLSPEDFAFRKKSQKLMDTRSFKKYINRLQMFGQTALKERIALNMRYASVFCHVIVMMMGIPFALAIGPRFGKILSFTLAVAASFLYWGVQAITQSLGENSILSPFMAAWLPNFIFLVVGTVLLIRVKK